MGPSISCFLSLRSGSVETTRKYSVLWEICVTGKRLIKKAFPASLNFTKSTVRFWKPSRKYTRVFVVSAGSTHDCFRNTADNAWERKIWYVARVFQCGKYYCGDTCCIMFCRARIIQCDAQNKNLPPQQHMGQQRVSNIKSNINIKRNTANSIWTKQWHVSYIWYFRPSQWQRQ